MTSPTAPRPTRVRYYVLVTLCVITFINYIQRNSFGGLESTIRENLSLTKNDTGLAIAAFFWIYALMQIPTGKLAQRLGPRTALTAYAAGWSVAAALLGLSVGIVDLVAYRSVMGALQAGIFPCCTLIMVAWLPPTQRGFGSALLNSFQLLGSAAVSNFTGFLLQPFGWRGVMFIYAVPGILFAVWFYYWFRNRPEEHAAVNEGELKVIGPAPVVPVSGTSTRSWSAVTAVLLSVPLWLLCAQQFCRAGANRYIDSWFSTYLQEVPLAEIENADDRKKTANHLTSIPQYVGVVTGLIGGLLSDWVLRRTGRRRLARNGVAIVALGLAVLCFVPVFYLHGAVQQVAFISLGFGIAAFAAPCAYALSMDISRKNLPIVFGAMNMVGNFGAAAMAQVVPTVTELGGGWRASLFLFAGVHAIAIVFWLFLNPNRTVGERE